MHLKINKPEFIQVKLSLLALLGAVFFIQSCRQLDIYEKNLTIPGAHWQSDRKLEGSILVKDLQTDYNIYVVLRHTDAYRYNNIWLNIGLQAPGDSMKYQKVNLQLGNDQQGWEGTGMDDIWEVRKRISPDSAFFRISKAGEYRFSINQEMRDNPLDHILSAGLRIEKVSR